MKRLFLKIFDIRQGEGWRVMMMFSYIFLIIASLLIVKPVRNSLFLTQIGVAQLPYVFLLVAIFAAGITKIHSRFSHRIRLDKLVLRTFLISIGSLFIFWIFLQLDYRESWFYYLFYIWVTVFGVITTSHFWLLANYVFNAREAKRLFGFVGAGAISGGIFGGYLTKIMVPVVGTKNMIFFCVAFITICIIILSQVWRKCARSTYRERSKRQSRIRELEAPESPLRVFAKSRHLLYLAAIVGTGVIVASLVDYQFSAIASVAIPGEDNLTAFFGFWLSNLSIASLIIQIFFTGRILKLLGVTASLFFLPIGIFFGAVMILFNPALWSAVLIKVSDGGFKQSVNKAGLELLILPVPTVVKNQAKAFIDVFVDSLATGIGGFLLIIFIHTLGFSTQHISFIIVGFIALWIYFIRKVRSEYVNSFREALEHRSIDLEEQTIQIEDASVADSLVRVLNGKNERQILYVLKLIAGVNNEKFLPCYRRLLDHPSSELRLQVLKGLKQYKNVDFTSEIYRFIHDDSFEVQVEAIRYLYRFSPAGNLILGDLLEHRNHSIRCAALLGAALEYNENEDFEKHFVVEILFENFLKSQSQVDYNNQERVFIRINIARFIGIVKITALYPFLQNLLHDEDQRVVEAAVISAGQTGEKQFIGPLVENLNNKFVRKRCRESLASYGEDVVEILEDYFRDERTARRIRLSIPKILAKIESQRAVDFLLQNLDTPDFALRIEIIRALNELRTGFPSLQFETGIINEKIMNEADGYLETLGILYAHKRHLAKHTPNELKTKSGHKGAEHLLIRALSEKLEKNLERIFRLLGLRYSAQDIYNAYLGVISYKSDLHANAVEFLDNILDFQLKKTIVPIVESRYAFSLTESTSLLSGLKLPSMTKSIDILLNGDDNWVRAVTLYFAGENKLLPSKWPVEKFRSDPDPVVKETAEFLANRFVPSI